MKGDDTLTKLLAEVDADERLEIELGEALGRFRARRALAILDREAASLLPLGAGVVVERQQCHRSTVYRRVSRFQKVARQPHDATKG